MSGMAAGKGDEENRRKSDYIYLEAQRVKSLDNQTAYASLIERAWELDTTQTFIGSDLGYVYLMTGRVAEGYRLMKKHFESDPNDYYSTSLYGQVAERVGDAEGALKAWSILDSLYPGRPEIALRHADAMAARGDSASLRGAISIVEKIENAIGRDITLTAHKSSFLNSLGDSAAIIDEAMALIEYSPQSSQAYLFAGEIYNLLHNADSTIFYFNWACEIDPDNGNAFYRRAEFYRERGDSAAYDREVFNVLANTDLDIEAKTELLRNYVSDLYQDTLQRPRITEMFELMSARHPHDLGIRDLYGAYLNVTEDYRGAAEQFDYALDLSPDDEQRAAAVCQLYLMAEMPEEANAKAVSLQERFPKNPIFSTFQGYAEAQLKDYQAAIAAFDRAIDLTPEADSKSRSTLVQSIGDMIQLTGDTIGALGYYEKAIEINPDNSMALNNLAYFLTLTGGDLDRAEELSYKTVLMNPTSPTELDTYAWVMFKKKDYKKAKEYIDRAISFLEEDSADVLEHAGDIYYFNGEPDKALELWKRAAVLDPENALLQKKVAHKTYFYK